MPVLHVQYIGVMHGDEKGHISAVLRLVGELCDPLSEPKFAPGGVLDSNVTVGQGAVAAAGWAPGGGGRQGGGGRAMSGARP